MTLPFRDVEGNLAAAGTAYTSVTWPGLRVTIHERHVKASVPSPVPALSSAIVGGGMTELDRVFNIYVDKHYRCDDPLRDIERLLAEWQEPRDLCSGLLTAVKLQHTSIQEWDGSDFGLLCCTTAGVSNAARAGSDRLVFDACGNEAEENSIRDAVYVPGTINIMLWVNGRMTPGAMVNAVQTAVEAKAAALADCGVRDADNGLSATGTTTDAIVLAVRQDHADKPLVQYAGTATVMGAAIGRLVYDTVKESLEAGQWVRRQEGEPR
ncbi:adenosylcobinamide amidohydrolase [Paenibacillus sp. FSL W8-0426]|uniref:adenosylcobinamide amidohydrolase n=1 Tax=Paenibacillus sp. FSL W8-0426 TaxID=2921714 RepID=UPI0030D98BEF